MNRKAPAIRFGLLATVCMAVVGAGTTLSSHSGSKLIEGELLHTGMRVTPTAAPGAIVRAAEPRPAGFTGLHRRAGGQHGAQPGWQDAAGAHERIQPHERSDRKPRRGVVERVRVRLRRQRRVAREEAGPDACPTRSTASPGTPTAASSTSPAAGTTTCTSSRRSAARGPSSSRHSTSATIPASAAAPTSRWPQAWPSTPRALFWSWRTCCTTRSPWSILQTRTVDR